MKTKFSWSGKLVFTSVGLALVAAGCRSSTTVYTRTDPVPIDQPVVVEQVSPPPVVVSEAPPPAPQATVAATAPPAPIVMAAPAPAVPKLSPPAEELVKLSESGVSEDVITAFVANSQSRFNLSSDQIIYLNDLGVSGNVVSAMIQHDTAMGSVAPVAAVPATPVYEDVSAAPPTYATAEPGSPPPVDYVPDYAEVNTSADYYYGSLAPYGTWVDVAGYGRCWRPAVYAVNTQWRPYSDGGRWLYTDAGWYWQSDYSWGWAPFHYGRWFTDARLGWVWCPDRVWGPAWVSWRQSPDVCGWAPLPPVARFVPGVGFSYRSRSVGVSFEFGLSASLYTFVPVADFCETAPFRHRVPPEQVFSHTTVINNVTVEHDRIFNHGIDRDHVAAVTHHEIRQVAIKDAPPRPDKTFRPERLDKSGNTLTVWRPQIPAPDTKGGGHSVTFSPPGSATATTVGTPNHLPRGGVPVAGGREVTKSPGGNRDNQGAMSGSKDNSSRTPTIVTAPAAPVFIKRPDVQPTSSSSAVPASPVRTLDGHKDPMPRPAGSGSASTGSQQPTEVKTTHEQPNLNFGNRRPGNGAPSQPVQPPAFGVAHPATPAVESPVTPGTVNRPGQVSVPESTRLDRQPYNYGQQPPAVHTPVQNPTAVTPAPPQSLNRPGQVSVPESMRLDRQPYNPNPQAPAVHPAQIPPTYNARPTQFNTPAPVYTPPQTIAPTRVPSTIPTYNARPTQFNTPAPAYTPPATPSFSPPPQTIAPTHVAPAPSYTPPPAAAPAQHYTAPPPAAPAPAPAPSQPASSASKFGTDQNKK